MVPGDSKGFKDMTFFWILEPVYQCTREMVKISGTTRWEMMLLQRLLVEFAAEIGL